MDIQYISLTGADNNTAICSLEKIQAMYPKTEWAILMFPEREGDHRNPTKPWRESFYKADLTNKALHLCGTAINKLAQENNELIKELNNYQRVQINLKPNYATHELVQDLVSVVKKLPHIQFITQYNDNNKDFFPYWNEITNHAYLFDASLGKGVSPANWDSPVTGKFCGYAGGLSPENIGHNIKKIKEVVGNQSVWLDMESGIRTENQFDLEKVRSVLEIVNQY